MPALQLPHPLSIPRKGKSGMGKCSDGKGNTSIAQTKQGGKHCVKGKQGVRAGCGIPAATHRLPLPLAYLAYLAYLADLG